MSAEKSHLDALITSLKKQRDELAVQIHLGKTEAKEEWARLEEKIQQLTADYEPVKDAVADTAENVLAALKLAADEVQAGLTRVKKLL